MDTQNFPAETSANDSVQPADASRRTFLKDATALGVAAVAGAAFLEFLSGCGDSGTGNSGGGTGGGGSTGITVLAANLPAAGAALYLNLNGTIIANGSGGASSDITITRKGADFVALTRVCTHQQCNIMTFTGTNWACPCHGSQFNQDGGVVNGPALSPLTKYTTKLETNGNLTITTA